MKTFFRNVIEYVAPEPFTGSTSGDPIQHFALATVADNAGNQATVGIEFFVDGVAPIISGISPSAIVSGEKYFWIASALPCSQTSAYHAFARARSSAT